VWFVLFVVKIAVSLFNHKSMGRFQGVVGKARKPGKG
jgi:hypothetical protein